MDLIEINGTVYRWSARGFREAMARSDWTGAALASRLGVSEQAVSYWRQGVAKPRHHTMVRLVRALGDYASLAVEKVTQ